MGLHVRRITALEFHPVRDDLVISGDKVRQCCWHNEGIPGLPDRHINFRHSNSFL